MGDEVEEKGKPKMGDRYPNIYRRNSTATRRGRFGRLLGEALHAYGAWSSERIKKGGRGETMN